MKSYHIVMWKIKNNVRKMNISKQFRSKSQLSLTFQFKFFISTKTTIPVMFTTKMSFFQAYTAQSKNVGMLPQLLVLSGRVNMDRIVALCSGSINSTTLCTKLSFPMNLLEPWIFFSPFCTINMRAT